MPDQGFQKATLAAQPSLSSNPTKLSSLSSSPSLAKQPRNQAPQSQRSPTPRCCPAACPVLSCLRLLDDQQGKESKKMASTAVRGGSMAVARRMPPSGKGVNKLLDLSNAQCRTSRPSWPRVRVWVWAAFPEVMSIETIGCGCSRLLASSRTLIWVCQHMDLHTLWRICVSPLQPPQTRCPQKGVTKIAYDLGSEPLRMPIRAAAVAVPFG